MAAVVIDIVWWIATIVASYICRLALGAMHQKGRGRGVTTRSREVRFC